MGAVEDILGLDLTFGKGLVMCAYILDVLCLTCHMNLSLSVLHGVP